MNKFVITVIILAVAIVSLAIGGLIAFLITKSVIEKKLGNARNVADKIIQDANEEASSIKKEAILEAKEESLKITSEAKKESERDYKERRNEISKMENYDYNVYCLSFADYFGAFYVGTTS